MKVQMREWYQDSNKVLQPEQIVEVDEAFGGWLVEHHKAVVIEQAGSIHDVEPQFENANIPPHFEPEPQTKRSRSRK